MTRIGWLGPLACVAISLSTACGKSADGGESSDEGGFEPSEHKGAFSFTVGQIDPLYTLAAAGKTCPTTETFTFGDPPPTPTTPGGLIQNGDGPGIGVFCVVVTAGQNPYIVDVSAVEGADMSNEVSLQLSSQATDPLAGATDGSLLVITPSTGILHSRDSLPCTIAPIRTLEGGSIAADFACPVVPALDDSAACSAYGTVEFRDCDDFFN